MSTRRTLEVWNESRSIVFRSKLSGTTDDVLAIVRCNEIDFTLDGSDLEAIHQFTYDLLAGPHRDPRLDVADARIVCGAAVTSPTNGYLECALEDGHRRVIAFDHITSNGIAFDDPAPF